MSKSTIRKKGGGPQTRAHNVSVPIKLDDQVRRYLARTPGAKYSGIVVLALDRFLREQFKRKRR